MDSGSRGVLPRRSRRIAGFGPSYSRNVPRSTRKRTGNLPSALLSNINTSPARTSRRLSARKLPAKRKKSVQMVNARLAPTTSDSSSQTSEPTGAPGTIEPCEASSSTESSSSSTPSEEQPSTSRGLQRGRMGTAFGSARSSTSSENDIQEASRRSRSRSRRRAHRAIMSVYRGGIPSSMPVKGESYCDCPKQGRDLTCSCGEEDTVYEWCWDQGNKSAACDLSEDKRMSIFHVSYSSGTAAVRGTQPMTDRQYFWEIKMTSPVYGTDMMVGVGTATVNLNAYRHAFTSLLGRDGESWGLSYYGRAQHKGQFEEIKGAKFGQGTILGVHVDMWHGTVSYYKNRRPLGVAYHGLAGKTLFPMVASTAARTAMKVIKARSFPTSLQFLCCQVLRKLVPPDMSVIAALQLPPGLRAFLENNLSWLLRPSELAADLRPRRKRSLSSSESDDDSEDDSDDDDDEGPLPKRVRH